MFYYFTIIFISVILHEIGHLLALLYFNVKVKAVSLGFGKVLLHKKWKNIDWRLSLIPLGGYCDSEEAINQSNSLSTLKYWQQVIVVCAGVLMNFMIACLCYLYMYKSIYVGIVIDLLLIKSICLKDYTNIVMIVNTFQINLYLLQISVLNLFLVITNLLPIPALDGGFLWLLPLKKFMNKNLFSFIIKFFFTLLMIVQIILIYYWWIL